MTGQLVLLRHGQSTANAAGIFTGLRDAALTEKGITEATRAGSLLLHAGIRPDHLLTSTLERALHTAEIVTDLLGRGAPIESTWRLNERNYGALTGMSKQGAKAALGTEEFFAMRRTRTGRPPRMSICAWLALGRTPALRGLPWPAVRRTESLLDVIRRVRPVLSDCIIPLLRDGRSVLVVAHGNSLRALCACMDDLTDGEIADLNLPTGEPLLYRFDGDGGLCPRGGQYLHPAARAAAAAVAAEGGT
ncbi:2,3-bisphosphoglycerate-dependent phosphoglycerate mutase [Friedmanniella endophytica]|uniref:2,3-bisphosphoglycerate-dependent phosphoglycerate mutase n=1 Tax=Microlunatus kandeliicorticis TaxID=1759536 RepID=A0A7W3IPM8_9ACTN|nr:2,3-bisphosphoglycerate-dependent phosphoglycerate mutase [Microlunatus kandeliicorticis]MBA8792875.1 2,3-bisphosphoglycerate-dependent phosphoglycerate mutase [Microlunatus kandeliicorticis]